MRFKETEFGDLSNKIYNNDIKIDSPSSLTSLEGSPKEINGHFNFQLQKVDSLEGSPKIVNGDFICAYNLLTSLKGSPEIVTGDFYVSYNKGLTSLEHCTKNIGKTLIFEGIKHFKNKEKIKKQIIENQIKANKYIFNSLDDKSTIFFKDIEKEFNEFNENILKKEKLEKIKSLTKLKKEIKIQTINKSDDYGYSLV